MGIIVDNTNLKASVGNAKIPAIVIGDIAEIFTESFEFFFMAFDTFHDEAIKGLKITE